MRTKARTRVALAEGTIYSIAGAIVGLILTFAFCGCSVALTSVPADGSEQSGTIGDLYVGSLLGGLYFIWIPLFCGTPLGFVLGAMFGAGLVLTEKDVFVDHQPEVNT